MDSGDLNRRIRLLRWAVGATNAFGEPGETWKPERFVWAGKMDANDATRQRAAEVGSALTAWFKVRFSGVTKTLTTKDRLSFKGRVYKIGGIKEIEDGRFLELTCVALDPTPP